MMNSDVLDEQFTIERGMKAAHTSDTDLTKGSPVEFLNLDGVSVCEYRGDLSRFAGVLVKDIDDGDSSSAALVAEGSVKVNFKNHASAIASTASAPVYCAPAGVGLTYFTYVPYRTRFLLTSNQSSGTAIHTVADGDPASITILPSAYGENQIVRYWWDSPAALNTQALKSAYAASSGTAGSLATFTAQPDFARRITVQPTGTTTNVSAGTFVATGTNIRGETITDEIVTGADQTSASVSASSKAFKTVTSITIPGQDGPSAQFNIGYNDALGLPFKQRVNGNFRTYFNGALEGTAATVTTDATDVAENVIDLNTALDAAGDVEAVFEAGSIV